MTTASWTAPTHDGGSPVTGYTLHMLTNDEQHLTVTAAADATSVDLSAEMAAADGIVWLTADNAHGTSQMSAEITYAAPVAPPDDPGDNPGDAALGQSFATAELLSDGTLVWDNTTYPVGTDTPYHSRYFIFTAAADGTATFSTANTTGADTDADTYLALYDADTALLQSNDDVEDGVTSLISYDVTAGSTYYLRAGQVYGDDSNTAFTLDTTLPVAGGGGGGTPANTFELVPAGGGTPSPFGPWLLQRFSSTDAVRLQGASVRLQAHSDTSADVTFSVYATNGDSIGATLAAKTVTQSSTAVDTWLDVTFDEPIDVSSTGFYLKAVTTAANIETYTADSAAGPFASVGGVNAEGTIYNGYSLATKFVVAS